MGTNPCPCDGNTDTDMGENLEHLLKEITPHLRDWIIIGISGVTCGGKTTLSNKLLEKLYPAYVFHQDKYFYPDDYKHHVPVATLSHHNYDILQSLDMRAMTRDVTSLVVGRGEGQGSRRREGGYELEGKKFLILEGFTILNYKPLLELCNLRYYFVLSYEECLSRRVFRLYEPPDVAGYFELCVWPEHLKYRAEIEKDHRVRILDGTRPDSLEVVIEDLIALGAKQIED